MSCDTTKFTISKGSENTFVFTIKQDNSTLPLTILSSDIFSAKLTQLGSEPEVSSTHSIVTPITGSNDALNGRITLVLAVDDIKDLVSEKGSKVDRYYAKPTYKLTLDCDTTNNGKFIAKVDEVYVD